LTILDEPSTAPVTSATLDDRGPFVGRARVAGRAPVRHIPVFVDHSGLRRRVSMLVGLAVVLAGALLVGLLWTAATEPGPADAPVTGVPPR
jgi:hypothetical protein